MKKVKKRTQNKRRVINPLRAVLMSLGILAIVGGGTYGGYCAYTHYDKQNKEIKQLNTELDTKAKLLAESEANLKNKQSELASAKAEVESLTQDKNALQAKLAKSETTLTTLTKEKAELQKELETVNAKLEVATTERNNLQAQFDSLATDKENLQTEINSLNEQISTKDVTIEQLTQDKANLQAQINNYTTQITTLQSENEVLNGKIDTLNNTIAEKNNKIDALNEIITNLTNEVNNFKQIIEVDGYAIETVQECVSVMMTDTANDCGYEIVSGQTDNGTSFKTYLSYEPTAFHFNDMVAVLKGNERHIIYINKEQYWYSNDTENYPTNKITLNNVGEISVENLDDNAIYAINFTVEKSEIYEGTKFIKSATINYSLIKISPDPDLVSAALMDNGLYIKINADNASYKITAISEDVSGAVIIPATYDNGLPITTIDYRAFFNRTDITSVELSENITSIELGAFQQSGITEIVIPKSVTLIDNAVFFGCESLTSVTIKATTPPTLGHINAFENNATIYVPAESLEAYKTADVWKDIADKIQAIVE